MPKLLGKKQILDMNIIVGKKERMPVRLVTEPLPEEVIQERLRRENAKAKKNGSTVSKKKQQLLSWSIYITNVPKEMLSISNIHHMYTARWQIELLFKLFKSNLKIDEIRSQKPNRVMCHIYAKLCAIAITMMMTAPFRIIKDRELSLHKAMKMLQNKSRELSKVIKSNYKLKKFMEKLVEIWSKSCLKDKRKQRITTLKTLNEGQCYA